MDIVVTGRHIQISERFRGYLDERLGKIVQIATKGTTNPPTAKPTPTPTPTPSVPPGAVSAGGFDEAAAATLGREIAGLVAGSKVAIGVGLRDVGSGRTFVYSTADTFELASSVKVDVLAATMIKARDGGRSLTATQRAQATTMIRNSDNTAAMAMFNAMGRAAGMDSKSIDLVAHDTILIGKHGTVIAHIRDGHTRAIGGR